MNAAGDARLSTPINGSGTSAPGKGRSGVSATFHHAKAGFEAAWLQFLPTLTEANFQEWRDQRDWTAKKYAIWARGELMPSQKPSSNAQPSLSA
jgi:hypothetical protein